MAGFDDLVNQGKELYEQNKDKVSEFLKSEQAEDISDKVLDGAADLAKKVVPEEHHDKVDGVRGSVDGAVGHE
ncbi:Rv0909 family putative TA system antitoxin [Microbacterium allomyrinae]|uniref:Antitoxin n=1 Tax=Microbacterium allomyrinae TaxID=2830666 RepID=A0A9X1S4W2_9MICO|nr:Rv0909 family putative TA system antitoxin [Microbacterium allomyrinae]MCC2033583.1 antitoxin [Microbacterium allomyrinae]